MVGGCKGTLEIGVNRSLIIYYMLATSSLLFAVGRDAAYGGGSFPVSRPRYLLVRGIVLFEAVCSATEAIPARYGADCVCWQLHGHLL
jgi:hypothetical protein